jgi:hypothetical protein
VSEQNAFRGYSTLLLLVLVYGAASLLHFAHNAVYLHEYPNLPASLTSTGVCAAWCGVTAVGALGFGGLDHYAVAPIAAHSMMMNLTILGEAAAASSLVIFVAHSLLPARPVAGRHRVAAQRFPEAMVRRLCKYLGISVYPF